jgi:tight adherence protein B
VGRRFERWFVAADLRTSADHWLRTTALLVAFAVPLATTIDVRIAPFVGLVVVAARSIQLAQRVRTRPQRLLRLLPGLLEAVAAELRAGASLAQAVRAPREVGTPGHELLDPLQRRIDLGANFGEALDAWSSSDPEAELQVLIAALRVAADRGGRIASVLERIAAASRERHQVLDELRVQTTQARLSAIIVAVSPIGFLLLTMTVAHG